MSQRVSLNLIQELREAVEQFAKEIQENGLPTDGKNLNSIQRGFEEKFKDDLILQGVPKTSAKRIAIQTAGNSMVTIMSDTIQAY